MAILGPRQTGKTTLARQFAGQYKQATTHFDLAENLRAVAIEDLLRELKPW